MRVRFQPFWERVFFSPDSGGGDGGGGDGETFTKDQVEQLIQGRLAKTKAENAELKKSVAELQTSAAKVAELEAQILALKNPEPNPGNLPPDMEGKLKLLESKHNNELKALNDKMEIISKEREQERTRRMQVERDNELAAALREAGCRADAEEVGSSYFKNQITYDQDDGKWVFTLRKGGTVSVKEGVAEELPDYLKEPTMRNGGSGSSSGGKGTAKVKELDEAKTKLERLRVAAGSGMDDDILKYQNQKRVVGQLEAELVRK